MVLFCFGVKMAVFKIEKNKNYTVMSNYHLRDKNLSYKAKGLLSFMLSLPEDWDYSINGLTSISKEGVKAIKNILKELKNCGYLVIDKKQNEIGQYEYEYLIYEYPEYQKGEVDLGEVEKGIQINTNKQNTKKQIDKIDKEETESSFFDTEKHNRLTRELINSKYIDTYDSQITSYDKLFDNLLINNSYQDLIKIVKYIVPRVISRGFKDENGKYITNKLGYLKNAVNSNINKLNSYSNDELWNYDNDYIDNIDIDLKDYDEFER